MSNRKEYADFMVKPIDIMIAGTQKAGTTSLLKYLCQHPHFKTHPQTEMVYFVNEDAYASGYSVAYNKYFRDYTDENSILLAKHVYAMYSRDAIVRIHQHNSNMYLIVVLRNPIDRAYSAYWYARRRGWENIKTFENALDAESDRIKKKGWYFWRHCAYVYNGMYYHHLEWILENFRKEQVLIITSRELASDAKKICNLIFERMRQDTSFVPETVVRHNTSGIPRSESFAQIFSKVLTSSHPLKKLARSLIPDSLSYKIRHKILKLNDKSFVPPEMNSETRQKLVKLFKPHNEKLEKLLSRDLSHWDSV